VFNILERWKKDLQTLYKFMGQDNQIIIAENVSKKFIISHEGNQKYTALRDIITNNVKNLFSSKKGNEESEEFWSLRNLNFSINKGDRIGVIGRNGAGKSTLLKVLSRITEPTEGKIKIRGRVASLLEVGTGFHPELTGRENIYLNGAILGMTRAEIKLKFDEIVAFAEVEKFLDTPVKRYSSGMYVRLAFAVAAHLEPEILIIDEVLAVGDAQFQKKSLGKMDDVSKKDGRTVIFVSHNMDAVTNLCNKCIYLKKGEMMMYDDTRVVIDAYLKDNKTIEISDGQFDETKAKILNVELDSTELLKGNIKVTVEYNWPLDVNPSVGITFSTMFGAIIFGTNFSLHHNDSLDIHTKHGIATFYVDNIPLHSGSYNITVYLGDGYHNLDIKFDVLTFDFISNSGVINPYSHQIIGPLNLPARWELKPAK
jgi:lipopolysaccharide transport system ATP-binding protein